METRLILTVAIIAIAIPVSASEAQLKEGNRLFRVGKYDQALKQYKDAMIDAPNSSVLRFNAGDAAYLMGDFSTAEKYFAESGDRTPVAVLRGASRYNQGNALFRQGRWKEAAEAFKDSLRANPQDQDAKYNLGIALQAMKNPPQPQKPQSGQGKKDKDQKGGQGSKENKPDPSSPKPGEMSQEDAQRLLSAAGAGEKKKPNAKASKPGIPHPDEDW